MKTPLSFSNKSSHTLSRLCTPLLVSGALLGMTLHSADIGKVARQIVGAPFLRVASTSSARNLHLPNGLSLADWNQIAVEYERHRHGVFPDGRGSYQSRSHHHGWLVRFDGRGVEVDPDTESWKWGLEMVSWGREGRETAVSGQAEIVRDVNRLEYRRQGITEWFVNRKEGLEHGFTIMQRPEASGRELWIRLRHRGDLVASMLSSGQDVVYRTAAGELALYYRKLMVTDATGRRLRARLLVRDNELCFVVEDRISRYPLTVDPIVQQAYLKASNPAADDLFGRSVAVSGDTVVVGAPFEDSAANGVNGSQSDNGATNSGAAYVFIRTGSTWTQQAYLKASNTGAGDLFGERLAISGNTLVVGAHLEDSAAAGVNGDQSDNSASDAGAAYVFVRTGTTWVQQAYLKASNTGIGDVFAWSLSIDGNTIVIGAVSEDSGSRGVNGNQSDDTARDSGAAYVFTRTGTIWSQQAYLKASNTEPGDAFGMDVALSGETIVVGAIHEDSSARGVNGNQADNGSMSSGAAYVFVRMGTSWSHQAYLKASNSESGDIFGERVSVSAETVIIGATGEDSNSREVNSNESDNSASNAGAAYIFVRKGTTWSQQAYLKASNASIGSLFGSTVGIDGDTVIVGARLESSGSAGIDGEQGDQSMPAAGAAYLFIRSGTTWTQRAYLKASNPDANDWFGRFSVGISGNTIVIPAFGEDGGDVGVNGNQADNTIVNSGAAYIFHMRVSGLAPESYTARAEGIAGMTVLVNAEPWVPWSVTSFPDWVSFATPTEGVGSGSVSYTVAANPSVSSRTGTIAIGGLMFTLTQSGATPLFRLGSAAENVSAASGAGTVDLTVTPNDGSWAASSNVPWLTIAPVSGSGSALLTYSYTDNSQGAVRTGNITVGGQVFVVTQAGVAPPTLSLSKNMDSVPMSGGAGRTITVTATAGIAWSATPTASWITIIGGSSGVGSGAVTYTVQPNSAASSRTGTIAIGAQTLTVTQSGPTSATTGPIAGTGSSGLFRFQFTHPQGFDKLDVVNVLINQYLDGDRACYIAYSQPSRVLYLVNDNGPGSGISSGLTLGGTGSVSNSQCSINASGSSIAASGNTLTLTLDIQFKPVFAGSRVVYLAARDGSGGNSGWFTHGVWTIPGIAVTYPRPGGVSPATGTVASSVISYTFDDQAIANNLKTVWALINTAIDGRQACYVAYYAPGNRLYLYPDNGDGAQAPSIQLTGTNSIENSQCKLSSAGSSVSRIGPRLTLNLNVEFKAGFTGPRVIWTAAQTVADEISPWTALGSWMVQ